ncbi:MULTISPECIES: response regulator [Maribacter]|uniref:Response regulator n=1 Tax=Maribacter flavus TaxID=1658664 RepID=A0A5B2U050_9FLAO|nr:MULTISPECIES: response regulator [Maribacter]KAA2219310.1 response regulator [Maribacter flavus]MDC6404251.1 response regulator [Maribacter sp. PR66]MEE1971394.1 response regulator [Maribacter flavus]
MKVLLIDDSEIDNYINKAIISKSKFINEVIVKTSGLKALNYLRELEESPEDFPDVIFLDIRMPEMDGFEFIEQYKNLPVETKGKCRVFMLSSSINPKDLEKSESYKEIEKHLAKPLAHHSLEELLL